MTFYRACDAYLERKGFADAPQARMPPAEALMTARVVALFVAKNLRLARQALSESGLVPYMLSESRFKPPLAQDQDGRLASDPDVAGAVIPGRHVSD